MAVIKKHLTDPVLRAKLAKGMGHTTMVSLLGQTIYYTCSQYNFWVFRMCNWFSSLDPAALGEAAKSIATH
jgi:hypothetical protein